MQFSEIRKQILQSLFLVIEKKVKGQIGEA